MLAIRVAYLYTRDRSAPGAYHVFNRGLNGRPIFHDDEDRRHFEWFINRYLTLVPSKSPRGREYASLRDRVRLNARNVMTTHFHLILWQRIPGGIEDLMHRAGIAYVKYYRQKHGGSGPLFAGEYRARRLDGPQTFKWRVAYVHDNHKRLGLNYEFSTHRLYVPNPEDAPTWLDVSSTLRIFGGTDGYLGYLAARETRNSLDADLRLDEPLR